MVEPPFVPLVLWGRVLTDGHELPPSRIEVNDGRITRIEPGPRPAHVDVAVDDGWIAAGLIDLQVNGAGGVDLTSARDPDAALTHVARTLASRGVTAFCPTLVSSPEPVIRERLPAYAPRAIAGGAESLGAHVEGPFIDPAHRGVHELELLRNATAAEIERWLSAGRPAIVTLAPDRRGAAQAIARLVQAGVVVSLGHSGATAEQAQAGLAAGASMATHLFNAMPALHHRAPGLVGALLASTAALGIIVDGVHLDRLVVDLVVKRAGPGRVVLVSDALAVAGAPTGAGVLGEQAVFSDGQSVRRADGTLAGSALLLDGCLRIARAWLPDVALAEVLRMATQTPAEVLGLRRKGRVQVGADADLIVLDAAWQVRQTIIGGEVVLPTEMGIPA
jgi:N-acetylglucosamine-6-phosphate deacetylase